MKHLKEQGIESNLATWMLAAAQGFPSRERQGESNLHRWHADGSSGGPGRKKLHDLKIMREKGDQRKLFALNKSVCWLNLGQLLHKPPNSLLLLSIGSRFLSFISADSRASTDKIHRIYKIPNRKLHGSQRNCPVTCIPGYMASHPLSLAQETTTAARASAVWKRLQPVGVWFTYVLNYSIECVLQAQCLTISSHIQPFSESNGSFC